VLATAAGARAAAAPTLTMIEPLDETVARPMVHVEASCDAAGAPCATITLLEQTNGAEPRTQLGTWQDVSHVSIDVEVPDGATFDLELHATDDAGTGTMLTRRVYGDTSPALHEVFSADGTIYDADLDRVLYEADGASWIFHRDGCTKERLGDGSAQALTPHGALLATCSGGCTLDEWRDGARLARGPVDPSSLRVVDGFAVWSEGYEPGPLHRLDLSTGIDTIVSSSATPGSGAVGSDGSVTYSVADAAGGHIAHRWAAGGDVALGPGDLSATDGTLSIFTDDDGACALRLYSGGASEELSTLCTSPAYLASVRAGWIAFVRPDTAGSRQLWTRSPAGALAQLTTTGCNLAPPLAPDGSVIARATIDNDSARWLLAAGAAPVAITHSDPHLIKHAGGHWLIAIGRTLFSLDDGLASCATSTVDPPAPIESSADTPAGGCSATRAPSSWLFASTLALLCTQRRRRNRKI